MIFHVTEIGTYERCQRKAVLTSSNGKHLAPMFSPLSLQTGTIVHRAHQLWLNDKDNKFSLEWHTRSAACEAQEQAIKRYVKAVGTEPNDDELAHLYESIEFCASMAINYQSMYSTKLPSRYTLIKPEQKVIVPVPGTKHHLQGKMDAFIYDNTTDEFGILERKTYSQRPKVEVLRRTPQFIGYAWQVRQLGLYPTNKIPFVLYDGLWRRHAPPKNRRFEELFFRTVLRPTQNQMAEFARFLPVKVNAMEFLYQHPHLAYPTIPWLGCGDCAFAKTGAELCDAMTENDQNMIEYFLANKFTKRTDDEEETDSE